MLDYESLIEEELREIEEAENSLSAFIKQAWHVLHPSSPYIHGWHIDAMADHFQAVSRGEITRLLINVPPGTLKSLLANVFWPAWEWGPRNMSSNSFLCAGHNEELAIRDNLKMRILITSDWFKSRYPHIILRSDRNSKSNFENTKTGFRQAMAMGSLTGSRADRVGLDDPLSVEDAQSETILNHVEFLFREVIPTRLTNPEKSAITVIMQRLHEKDTSGFILKNELGYTHLCLPMEYEPLRKCVTSIGFSDPRTEDGELLFPTRFPREVVERDKKTLGIYGTAGQFQQRPSPRGGGLIKESWLSQRYKVQRDGAGKLLLNSFKERYQSWDTAFKDGEQNDFSVCTTWGLKDDGIYLLHLWKMKVDFPTLEQRAIELGAHFLPNQILIEDKASGQSLIQALKRKTRLPIKAVKIDRDKIARVNAISGYFEAMRVWLPESESWLVDYIDEMTTFPAGAHDDCVDSTSQFFLEKVLRRENSLGVTQGSMISR